MRDEVLIRERRVKKIIKSLAKEIATDYSNEDALILLVILRGAARFGQELATELHKLGLENIFIHYLFVESYGNGIESNRDPKITSKVPNIENRHVLVVEDLADTLHTLARLEEELLKLLPASLAAVVMLEKAGAAERAVAMLKYVGETIENVWIWGFGINTTDDEGRANPHIMWKNPDDSTKVDKLVNTVKKYGTIFVAKMRESQTRHQNQKQA